jgi:hypothetical protein
MADPPLPTIKVTDAHLAEGSGTGTADSPSTTTDGGHSARPISTTSSEGQSCDVYTLLSPKGFSTWVQDDPMLLSLVFIAFVLMLTRLFESGNAQTNGKKSPIKLIRNNTNIKEGNGTKPTSPAAAVRPSTAIDPLSHVRTTLSYTATSHSKAGTKAGRPIVNSA